MNGSRSHASVDSMGCSNGTVDEQSACGEPPRRERSTGDAAVPQPLEGTQLKMVLRVNSGGGCCDSMKKESMCSYAPQYSCVTRCSRSINRSSAENSARR